MDYAEEGTYLTYSKWSRISCYVFKIGIPVGYVYLVNIHISHYAF